MAKGRGVRRVRHSYKAVPDPVLSPGFRAIVLYSIVIAICYLFALFIGVYNPAVFAIAQIRDTVFWALNLVIIAIIAAMIYGIRYRKPWAYPLAVLWFLASVLLSLISLFMVDTALLPVMKYLLWGMTIAVVTIDLAVLWYLTNRKQYFRDANAPVPRFRGEQAFVRVLGGCWVALLISSAVLGMSFYQQVTRIADQSTAELTDTTVIHALVLCDTKKGQERDVCYVVMATMFPEQDLDAICARVQSEFFRFTCRQAR